MSFLRRRANATQNADTSTDTSADESAEPSADESAEPSADESAEPSADPSSDPSSDRGPWDVDEVPEIGRRVDLGALRLPARSGMELRMEIEKSTQRVTAAAISLNGSILQVQAFAAPRSEGIWEEIRAEIGESVTKQGGSVDDVPGPFGRELLARLPARTPEGRTGHRPARFIGHDGPRWFLRGVLSGKAAVEEEAAAELEAVFADIVVVRGTEARAPRDLLALTLPGKPGPVAAPTSEPQLEPFARGPEITEVR